MKTFNFRALLCAFGLLAAPLAVACGSAADGSSEPAQTGTMTMNLSGTSNSGTQYRLRNASFTVSGTKAITFSTETEPDTTAIKKELPAGTYLITLKTGWSLEMATAGVFAPVNAVLVSTNPQSFSIQDQGVTQVVVAFKAGSDVVQLGDGTLNVSISVTDGNCPAGTLTCAGACVNVSTDPANCGACGVACMSGVCTAGVCAQCSGPGQILCGAGCVNVQSDNNNCGACGLVCGLNFACNNGVCIPPVCPMGTISCGASCVNVQSDNANCGMCGRFCPAGTACNNGNCQATCAQGTTLCGGQCRNLQSDNTNCGMCGFVCQAGSACTNGVCATSCAPPGVLCGGSCINVQNDPNNCGMCGRLCTTPLHVCSNGNCL